MGNCCTSTNDDANNETNDFNPPKKGASVVAKGTNFADYAFLNDIYTVVNH